MHSSVVRFEIHISTSLTSLKQPLLHQCSAILQGPPIRNSLSSHCRVGDYTLRGSTATVISVISCPNRCAASAILPADSRLRPPVSSKPNRKLPLQGFPPPLETDPTRRRFRLSCLDY